MRFVSTRGTSPAISFRQAVLSGLAPDGGLYMPERWPRFEDPAILDGLEFAAAAARISAPKGDDFTVHLQTLLGAS